MLRTLVLGALLPRTLARPTTQEKLDGPSIQYGHDLQAPLTFTSDGTFQLSIFEDLHFGENAWDQWGPQQDVNSIRIMGDILDAESQQLVVLNGDLITGENAYLENSTVYIDEIVGPIVNRSLPWASTYGNHDSSFNLSRDAILAREQMWPNARTASMVQSANAGVSNYYLPVYSADCIESTCRPELLLWFFDSRGGVYYQQSDESGDTFDQPDWVDQSVVDWFKGSNAMLQGSGPVIPSLAFVHIPTDASRVLQTQEGVDPNLEPGINDDLMLARQGQGWCSDGSESDECEYGGQDIPFMEALVSTPGLIALFSGHDHGDTWCYKWDSMLPNMTVAGNGINLCFGQHSGYGGYGNWIRGARQVLVTQELLKDNAVESWIRLEDKTQVGHVTLNATYGMDAYPATPNDKTYCPTCNYTVITPMPGITR